MVSGESDDFRAESDIPVPPGPPAVVQSTVMLRVVIPALEGTASIGTAGLMDALIKADKAWALSAGANAARVFEVRLVGLNRRPVQCRDGVRLHPSEVAREIRVPDLVVVPGLDDDVAESFALNRRWAAWIGRWHAAGARIASSCTGAFLVAESGVLHGRPATTHWLFAGELRAAIRRSTSGLIG